MVELERTHPGNKLLHGRGQPGTHDLPLLVKTLTALKEINRSGPSATTTTTELPVYNKSAYHGQGDRSPQTVKVEAPLDLVIFEGWCVGFAPLPEDELSRRYHAAQQEWANHPATHQRPVFLTHPLESLLEINRHVEAYYTYLAQMFDMHVALTCDSLDFIYQWRLEQEWAMKRDNGGLGMTDEEVRRFVERYMPGYQVWGASRRANSDDKQSDECWGRLGSLELRLGQDRRVLDVQER